MSAVMESIALSNACVTLLNFKCRNTSHRQGNVAIKNTAKHQSNAWTNSRLASLSAVLFQHLVILHRLTFPFFSIFGSISLRCLDNE